MTRANDAPDAGDERGMYLRLVAALLCLVAIPASLAAIFGCHRVVPLYAADGDELATLVNCPPAFEESGPQLGAHVDRLGEALAGDARATLAGWSVVCDDDTPGKSECGGPTPACTVFRHPGLGPQTRMQDFAPMGPGWDTLEEPWEDWTLRDEATHVVLFGLRGDDDPGHDGDPDEPNDTFDAAWALAAERPPDAVP